MGEWVVMDPLLLSTLTAYNPWLERPSRQHALLKGRLPSYFVERFSRLPLAPGRAELVVGPRQAGKSTWIVSELMKTGAPILLLHAEEPLVRQLAESPALALDLLTEVSSPETVFWFEEVQHLADAPLFIKGLVDLQPRRRIVATGSSSFTFRARHRESLAGRARRTRLLPFSLAELEYGVSPDLAPAVRDKQLLEIWERMALVGGFPEAWLGDKPAETLHYLAESVVLRDVSDFETVERPSAFRKLLELAAADIGNLANISEWASLAHCARSTATRYLDLAREAHVLYMVPPFLGGKRREITGASKIFFFDNGLRNALYGGFGALDKRPDRGALWENLVFNELSKRIRLLDEVLYWRSANGAEVDFIIRRGGRIVALEVKAGALQRPKLSRSGRSYIDAYRPTAFVVVHKGPRLESEHAGTPLLFRRPWELGEVIDLLGVEL